MGSAEKIIDDIKTAMKSGDKITLGVLRMLKSDLKYKQIELGRELTEDDFKAVLSSAAKKRRDSIEGFEKGARADLVAKEKAELEVIHKYLPQQLSDTDLERIIADVIAETNASTPNDIGLVMKSLMPKVKGRADGRKVNELVSQKLNG
jgi:uncharacterized protein YqeY